MTGIVRLVKDAYCADDTEKTLLLYRRQKNVLSELRKKHYNALILNKMQYASNNQLKQALRICTKQGF